MDEKSLKDYPGPTDIKGIKIILRQMQKCIAQIFTTDGTKGTGFFCKIPLCEYKYIKTFITNYHVINEENEIEIKLNDDAKKAIKINLENKFKYSNPIQDFIILEIKEDFDDLVEYLEIDENILKNNTISCLGKSIYIIHYPCIFEEYKASVSFGLLKKRFEDKKYNFQHFCSTENGSSGSPILNLSNKKVIGIHKQRSQIGEYNIGLFLNDAIKEFKHKFKYKNIIGGIKLENCKDKKLFIKLYNFGLTKELITIKDSGNNIIAYKFLLNTKENSDDTKNWITAWHGTSYCNLLSIVNYGLKLPGTKLKNGSFTPKTLYVEEDLINWDKAIFASPSLFFASYYAKDGFDIKGIGSFGFLLEIKIKPNSFSIYKRSKIDPSSKYHLLQNHTIDNNEIIYRITSEKSIIINSVTFTNKQFSRDLEQFSDEEEEKFLK